MTGTVTPKSPYKHVIEAPSPNDLTTKVKLGLRSGTFQASLQRSMGVKVAEYFAIVRDGLMSAHHCFRGVKREMADRYSMDLDQRIVVYTWRSPFAAAWVGSRFDGYVIQKAAPPGCVFAVLVREEDANEHGVFGSIEHWYWIDEDSAMPQAPVDWANRYRERLWSKT